MPDTISIVTLALVGLAILFSFLAFLRIRAAAPTGAGLNREDISALLRAESDRIRQSNDEQARSLRQEVGDNLRGFQETTVKSFGTLRESLESQTRGFGERLDTGVHAIEERAAGIAAKLDADIAAMGEAANKNREALRGAIETKLDDAAGKQLAAAKDLREEVAGSVTRLREALLKVAADQHTSQTEQFDAFARRLSESLKLIDQRSTEAREAQERSLAELGHRTTETLNQMGAQQKERLDNVSEALRILTEKHEKDQEALRATVESRLDVLRQENSAKLDEMRKTVDEKLQSTLEQRLGESFSRVVEQLERVHQGIGEMQTLAQGVGDLKKVLSNVSLRGALGEIQLAMLLEQLLSPEQLIKDAVVQEGSQERVEFAVRFPGRGSEGEVLLPIDAKFPQEDYERLLAAVNQGDAEAITAAGKALETRVKLFAKTISEKYIHPPRTTDFAILFLPTEGLYAEVLRRPGLFEFLHREYHVTLTGPTTLTALLNALQMGFRSLAIEKRSSEVWQVLGAVRNEFGKYNDVVDRIAKQLNTAANSVEILGTRTRAMNRKLRDVEKLPDAAAQALLDFDSNGAAAADDDEDEAAASAG